MLYFLRFGGNISSTSLKDIHSSFSDNEIPNILSLLDLVHSLPATSVINGTALIKYEPFKNIKARQSK